MRIHERYRPVIYVSTGSIMVYLSVQFLKYLGGTIWFFLATGNIGPLGATLFFMVSSWSVGCVEIFHGFALWRHRVAASKLPKF